MSDLVSVIMPVYNSAKYVEIAIKSVLSQTYRNVELIIIDDFSSDDSLSRIEFFSKKENKIKVIKLSNNSGAAVARNAGVEKANGRFLTFLDADDVWKEDFIELSVQMMMLHKCAFGYSRYYRMDVNGKVFSENKVDGFTTYKKLLKNNKISCLTAIFDVDKIGKQYFPINTKREDYALWLKVLKKVDCAYAFNFNSAFYRVYSEQSSGNKMKMAKENWLLYRKVENLSLFESFYYFINYAVSGVIKTKFPRLARLLNL